MNITAFGILALRAAGQGDVARSAGLASRTPRTRTVVGASRQAGAPTPTRRAPRCRRSRVAGGSSSALADGARYLAQTQKGDGGWTLAGGVVNSQSTAWAVQGLVAAHGSGSAISKGVSYLAKRQAGDGHYAYSAASDQTPVWVTAQALTAVTRRPFPLAAVARAPRSRGETPEGSDGPGGEWSGPGR